eukprot:15444743-Alexandrium_andersonii.AAC.1
MFRELQACRRGRCDSGEVGAQHASPWPARPVSEGGPTPQRHPGARSELHPNGRCAAGESALTGHFGVPLRGAPNRCAQRAVSPTGRG